LDVKLGGVEQDSRYSGAIGGMDRLVLDSFMVGVAVELGVKREVFVVLVIVLMSFDVSDSDCAWEVMEGSNDHVNDVPVGLKCAVREALGVRTGGGDALDEGIVVAA
jgi:hypothetical protein